MMRKIIRPLHYFLHMILSHDAMLACWQSLRHHRPCSSGIGHHYINGCPEPRRWPGGGGGRRMCAFLECCLVAVIQLTARGVRCACEIGDSEWRQLRHVNARHLVCVTCHVVST